MKKIIALVALAVSCVLMSCTVATGQNVTPNAGLQVPAFQQSNWQVPLIYDLTRIDNVFGGTVPVPSIALSGPIVNANQAATKAYVDATAIGFLSASGAVMTGPLVLAADPTAPLQAATKQYVDSVAAGGGGGGTGTITATAIDNALGYTPQSAANVTTAITASQTLTPAYTTVTLSGAIIGATQAATKAYVDSVAASISVNGFAGGTLTLPLILAGTPTTNLGAATKLYVDSAVAGTQAALGFSPVPNTTTVNGHVLSSNVVVSASDITTGTLPHAQLPALVSADVPSNTANTTGSAGSLSAASTIPTGTITATQTAGDSSNKLATDAFIANALMAYIPLGGGTMTGTLTLSDASPAASQAYVATHGGGGSGSSGFPITLGSTSVGANATTSIISGLTIDGVAPSVMSFVDFTSSAQTQLNGKQASLGFTPVANTVTVNGRPLSSNVTISASDLTTGVLPHAQLPALLVADIPALPYQAPLGYTPAANTITVNGHVLSANVVVSASDLTTGTLPHAQLPTLLSADIPAGLPYDGTGAAASAQTNAEGALTGDVTKAAGSFVTTVTKINGVTPAAVATSGSYTDLVNTPTAVSTAHAVSTLLKCADTSGSGTVQSCTTSPSFTPAANDCVIYTTTTSNTSAVAMTINVNGLGNATVVEWGGSSLLSVGDLKANSPQLMCYNGVEWNLSTVGNAPLRSGALTPGTTATTQTTGDTSLKVATDQFVNTALTADLPLSGGTLTGPLLLAADPTVALGAATKEYVDAKAGTATSLSAASALPNSTTATTQAAADSSTDVATDAFVATAISGIGGSAVYVNNGLALPTASILANSCTLVLGGMISATGVTTSMEASFGWASNPGGVAGYGSIGGLTVRVFPGSGSIGVEVCNPNSTGITPGAISINVRVRP